MSFPGPSARNNSYITHMLRYTGQSRLMLLRRSHDERAVLVRAYRARVAASPGVPAGAVAAAGRGGRRRLAGDGRDGRGLHRGAAARLAGRAAGPSGRMGAAD